MSPEVRCCCPAGQRRWQAAQMLSHSTLNAPVPPARLQVVATAQALLANGGIMAPVGMHIAAMAAK